MNSTRNLNNLPNIDILMGCLQSLAALDSILSPELEYRYYSFNSKWDIDTSMGSINNGTGDHLFFIFNFYGCIIKGFDHEASMSPFRFQEPSVWAGILDDVPADFSDYIYEVSLLPEETTFCTWKSYTDSSWETGKIDFPNEDDPDGSQKLLLLIHTTPQKYQEWAEEYYDTIIKIDLISHIFLHKSITEDIILKLNPKASIETVYNDLQEIGYLN